MAEIYREDAYSINIDGVSVRANRNQEAKIRKMTPEHLQAFLELMGKKADPTYGVIAREGKFSLRYHGRLIQANSEQREKIRRADADALRRFIEIMTDGEVGGDPRRTNS